MKKISLFIFFIYIFIYQHVNADNIYDKGKTIFQGQGNCAVCHALVDAGSNENIGPNLNEIKPDVMRVINAVTNGIGVMPPYAGELSPEEIEAVSHYVSEASKK